MGNTFTTTVATGISRIATTAEILAELGISSPSSAESTLVTMGLIRANGAVRKFLHYNPIQATHTEYHPMKNYSLNLSEGVWESDETEAFLRHLSMSVTNELQLIHLPIRSVTSLSIDFDGRSGTKSGSFATTETEGTDFWPNYDGNDESGSPFCLDGILRAEGTWPTNPGSVKVVYVAGYTADEFRGEDVNLDASPIWDVVINETTRRVKNALATKKSDQLGVVAGVLESERMGDYSYKINTSALNRLFGGLWDLLPESKEKLSPFVNYGIALEG